MFFEKPFFVAKSFFKKNLKNFLFFKKKFCSQIFLKTFFF